MARHHNDDANIRFERRRRLRLYIAAANHPDSIDNAALCIRRSCLRHSAGPAVWPPTPLSIGVESEEDEEEEESEDKNETSEGEEQDEEEEFSVSRIRHRAEDEFSPTSPAALGCTQKKRRIQSVPPIQQYGRNACQFVKGTIPCGAGNVLRSLKASGNRSKVAFEEKKRMIDSARDYRRWRAGQLSGGDSVKRRVLAILMRAAEVMKYNGGNCQEHADLTFYSLCLNASGIVIDYACGEDHAYVIAREPDTPFARENPTLWTVIDPWPHLLRVGSYADNACQACERYEVRDILIQGDGIYLGDVRLYTRDEIRRIVFNTIAQLPNASWQASTLPAMTTEALVKEYGRFKPYAMDGETEEVRRQAILQYYGDSDSESESDDDFQDGEMEESEEESESEEKSESEESDKESESEGSDEESESEKESESEESDEESGGY